MQFRLSGFHAPRLADNWRSADRSDGRLGRHHHRRERYLSRGALYVLPISLGAIAVLQRKGDSLWRSQ